MAILREVRKAPGRSRPFRLMKTPPLPAPKKKPPYTVAAARRLLEVALAAEDEGEAPEIARKRAVNACTGASMLLPPEVPTRAVPAYPPPGA